MKRVYAFDFLKFIASILIVFHHYQQIVGLFFEEGINFCWGRFNVGLLVEFFFLLSGFLLTGYVKPIQDGLSFTQFWGKRYLRLLPVMALAAVGYEALLAIFNHVGALYLTWYAPANIDIWGCIVTALGMQTGGVFSIQTINSPAWYISVLLICYAVFYLLVRVSNNKKIHIVCLFAAMVLLGIAIDTYAVELPFLNQYTKRGYSSFFWGAIVGQIFKDRDSKLREALGGLLLSGIVVAFIIFDSASVEYGIEYLMTYIVFPSIIVVFNLPIVKRVFQFGVWEVMGDISFGVYMWHINVLLAVYIAISTIGFPVPILSLKGMIFFTVICILVATVLHYVFEKPIAKVIGKRCVWTK
ncbi:MAG: acyltransferase [Lachnospiraceae bacterium]|nr:acyltransferase [Lachnospiraceae bacterium]